MLKCDHCGLEIAEKDALIRKNAAGKKEIICGDCFKKATGVDYKTFAYRRETAKQTFFAVLLCLCATIYAFVEKGSLYGAAGIALTLLIYFFAGKVR